MRVNRSRDDSVRFAANTILNYVSWLGKNLETWTEYKTSMTTLLWSHWCISSMNSVFTSILFLFVSWLPVSDEIKMHIFPVGNFQSVFICVTNTLFLRHSIVDLYCASRYMFTDTLATTANSAIVWWQQRFKEILYNYDNMDIVNRLLPEWKTDKLL